MKQWYVPIFRLVAWFSPTTTPPGWFSRDFGPSLDATVTASAEASASASAGLALDATVTASAESSAAIGAGLVLDTTVTGSAEASAFADCNDIIPESNGVGAFIQPHRRPGEARIANYGIVPQTVADLKRAKADAEQAQHDLDMEMIAVLLMELEEV